MTTRRTIPYFACGDLLAGFAKTALILAILMGAFGCSNTPADSQNVLNYNKSDTDYAALVSKVKNNQATANDFDMLVRVYPLTSQYEPSADEEQRAKLMSQALIQNEQWQQCLKTNYRLLDINYTSLTGHYGASVCATELGNIELGKFHNAVLDNLIETIWRTGSGQSPDSPFYITSVNDLYAFIQLHQLVAVGQSLTYVNELPIQAIQVQNPETKRTLTWYFNVTSQFRRGLIDKLENIN